jgi:hypothetical protein
LTRSWLSRCWYQAHLAWRQQSCQSSTCRCRRPGARPRRRWIVLRMWRACFATAAAGKPLFYFAIAAAGVIMGAASPRLCIKCQMVGGFVRIANQVTRPLHSTFPAGSGARAHGLRAKAGAPFLSFFLSFFLSSVCKLCATSGRILWAVECVLSGRSLKYSKSFSLEAAACHALS